MLFLKQHFLEVSGNFQLAKRRQGAKKDGTWEFLKCHGMTASGIELMEPSAPWRREGLALCSRVLVFSTPSS